MGFGVATGLEELPPEEPLLPPEELPPVEGLLEELLPLLPVEGFLEELPPLLPVEGLLEELLPLLPVEGLPEELLSPLPDTLLVGSASLSGFSDSFTLEDGLPSASTTPTLEEGSGVSATCPALHAVSSMASVRAATSTVFFIHLTSRFFFVEIISTDQIMVNCICRAVPGSSDGPPSLWEH